jgi:hypothetical protein
MSPEVGPKRTRKLFRDFLEACVSFVLSPAVQLLGERIQNGVRVFPKLLLLCRNKFRPTRSDAEFCSSQCRQAAYRTRKKVSIEAAGQKAEDAKLYADDYEYRGYAAYLRSLAKLYNAKVKFMGTPKGILAVEETPGALAAASVFWNGVDAGVQLQQWLSTKLHSTDRQVVEAILQPQLVGRFIRNRAK